MKCLLTVRTEITIVGWPAATLAASHGRIAVEMHRGIIGRRQIDCRRRVAVERRNWMIDSWSTFQYRHKDVGGVAAGASAARGSTLGSTGACPAKCASRIGSMMPCAATGIATGATAACPAKCASRLESTDVGVG